jgi:hypothetical protein
VFWGGLPQERGASEASALIAAAPASEDQRTKLMEMV